MRFLLLTLLFAATTTLSSATVDEYLVTHPNEQLLYTSSQAFPHQISVLNSTSNIGVIVDPQSGQIAVLNGRTDKGLVIDKDLGIGFEVKCGGMARTDNDMKSYLRTVNISQLVDDHSDTVFQLEEQNFQHEVSVFLEDIIQQFSPEFWKHLKADATNLFKSAVKFFALIMYPMKHTLAPIMELAVPTWTVFKGGFFALLNIFKWIGKLMLNVTGGVALLAQIGLVFPIVAIITATNGLTAFAVILKILAEKLNLMSVLQGILRVPAKISQFIVGLGGAMIQGVTGIFTIITELFSFNLFKIGHAIKTFTEMILNLLRGRRPTPIDVKNSTLEIQKVFHNQIKKHGDAETYRSATDLVESVRGNGNYTIHGVKVAPLVRVITTTSSSAKTTVMNALNVISPMVPFNVAVPRVLVNMVKGLNTTEGIAYAKQMFPSLKVPKNGLHSVGTQFRSGFDSSESLEEMRNLPGPQYIKQLPLVNKIYDELDEAARVYGNVTLESMLDGEHVGEIVEFTTKAFGLV